MRDSVIQIKICAEYRDMLPRPRLVCQEPGLRPIGRSPGVPDKSSRGLGSMSRYSAQILICFIAYIFLIFLAATKQLYEWYFLSVCPSVCPSVTKRTRMMTKQHSLTWKNKLKMPALKLRHMTKEMLSSLKLLITLTFLVISLPNQHMEFSHPKSFVMLGSAVRKLICLKGLRASPKNYYGNTTPSMAWSHHWRNVWRNIAGSRPNWAQDFTRTSQKNSRSSQKNYYQHSRNFGTSYFCLSYLLHKQAFVQLDEVTPVAGGLTLHSCYCN